MTVVKSSISHSIGKKISALHLDDLSNLTIIIILI